MQKIYASFYLFSVSFAPIKPKIFTKKRNLARLAQSGGLQIDAAVFII